MTYHGRILPIFARAVCDAATLKTVQSGGRAWGGVHFYMDRWAEFEMPAEDDPNYARIQRGMENGHLEVHEGPAPPTEMEGLEQSLGVAEKERDVASKQIAKLKTELKKANDNFTKNNEAGLKLLHEARAEIKALKAERDKLAAQLKPAEE